MYAIAKDGRISVCLHYAAADSDVVSLLTYAPDDREDVAALNVLKALEAAGYKVTSNLMDYKGGLAATVQRRPRARR